MFRLLSGACGFFSMPKSSDWRWTGGSLHVRGRVFELALTGTDDWVLRRNGRTELV